MNKRSSGNASDAGSGSGKPAARLRGNSASGCVRSLRGGPMSNSVTEDAEHKAGAVSRRPAISS